METIRVSDFTGGVSEVADPSAIPPNSAVSAYNVDPRTGVFTPVLGLGDPVMDTGVAKLNYYPISNGSHHLASDAKPSHVLWGDYILWSVDGHDSPDVTDNIYFATLSSYPRAAKYDKTTGSRQERRALGLLWTTREQNEAIVFNQISGVAFSFEKEQNNLSADFNIRGTIEPAADDLDRRPQRMGIFRTTLLIYADEGVSFDIAPGDWIVLVPWGTSGVQLCGRPAVVTDVLESGFTGEEGQRKASATLLVSSWFDMGTTGLEFPAGNIIDETGVWRSSPYGTDGFQETTILPAMNDNGEVSCYYRSLIRFKRGQTSFYDFIGYCRSITNYRDPDFEGAQYLFNREGDDLDGFFNTGTGGKQYYITRVGDAIDDTPEGGPFRRRRTGPGREESGVLAQHIVYDIYDYTIYEGKRLTVLGQITPGTEPDGSDEEESAFPLPFDLVCYADATTGTDNTGTPIIGVMSKASIYDRDGLNPGLYRYAFTQVDSWGRESAPWPLNEEDKNKPFTDLSGQAPDTNNTATYVTIGGFPIPGFSDIQKIRIYRTRSDAGEYFYHSEIERDGYGLFPQFVDTVSDFNLSVIPMLSDQYYPPGTMPSDESDLDYIVRSPKYLTEYRGVLFAAVGSRLVFSLPSRFYAWPADNFFLLPGDITGLLTAGDVLLIFTATHTYRLTGNTFSTMDFRQVSDEYGCVNHATAKLVNRIPVWCSLNGIAVFDGARVNIVTDEILADNSEQFKGAYAAVSHRGEYFVLLTPTQTYRPTKHNPLISYASPEFTNYLRYKPGAWVVFGRFSGVATDLAVDHHKGEIHAVLSGKARPMFKGTARQTANWKSGELHGGFKTLEKEAHHWFVTVSEGTVRLTITDTAGTKIEDEEQLAAGEHIKRFPAESFCRALSFEFKGSGVVTEFGYTFSHLALQ